MNLLGWYWLTKYTSFRYTILQCIISIWSKSIYFFFKVLIKFFVSTCKYHCLGNKVVRYDLVHIIEVALCSFASRFVALSVCDISSLVHSTQIKTSPWPWALFSENHCVCICFCILRVLFVLASHWEWSYNIDIIWFHHLISNC